MTTRHPAKMAKRGDQVFIEQQLTDLSVPGGQTDPIGLSGASIRFIMEGPDGNLIVNSSATVVDSEAGEVEYLFADGELPEAGEYRGEWRVIGESEDYRWPPGLGHLDITISEPIATDRDPAEIDPAQDIDVALIQADQVQVAGDVTVGSLTPREGPVDVTHPTYGAVGDGSTDDTAAIQDAIDAVQADGGGVVYFPPGVYRTTDQLDGVGDITYRGASRYLSRIRPDFVRDENERIAFLMRTSNASNITVENLGFDGREAADAYNDPDFGPLPDGENQEVIPGRWAITRFNDCADVTARSIAAWMPKHIMDWRDCRDIQISDWHYQNCFNGVSLIRSEDIDVRGLLAKNVTTTIDFANCDRAVVTNIVGTSNAYNNADEAIDMGASTRITVDDAELDGFGVIANVKGEADNSWENITFSNIRATNLQRIGFDLRWGGATDGSGDPVEMGDIRIDGCTIIADKSTTDGSYDYPDVIGISADGPVSETSIIDTKIDVTGRGIESRGGNYTISGGRTDVVSQTGSALYAYRAGDFSPEITIRDGYFSSASDPSSSSTIEVETSPAVTIKDAVIRGDGRGGIRLIDCQAPKIQGCSFESLRQNGIIIRYDSETSMITGGEIPAVVKNCEFLDWGTGGSRRAAVRYVLEGTTGGQYGMLAAKDNEMRIRPDNVASQYGIILSGTIDTVDNSDLSGNLMSDVQGAIDTGLTLANSVETDNITDLV